MSPTSFTIARMDGDGIGREVNEAAVAVLEQTARDVGTFALAFEPLEAGAELYLRTGEALPETVFRAAADADAILLGAMGLPDVRLRDGTEVQGEVMFRLRFELDLYAGDRPIRFYPGTPSPLRPDLAKTIDYVIVRENVEGLYASRGGGCRVRDELATDTIIITRKGTERICRYALERARARAAAGGGPARVTCVDKSNVLRSYAFFREVFDQVAGDYPDVETGYAYVDAMSLWLVQRPAEYDVLVAENMFGDILSDLAAATVGGMGMAPSGDIGDHHGLFQPAHGTAPDIAGQGIANPTAAILSGAMMLRWLGARHAVADATAAGDRIEAAVAAALAAGPRTPDLGGNARTGAFTEAVLRELATSTIP